MRGLSLLPKPCFRPMRTDSLEPTSFRIFSRNILFSKSGKGAVRRYFGSEKNKIDINIELINNGTNINVSSISLSVEPVRVKPQTCDPSSLPQYPPSKEIDTNMKLKGILVIDSKSCSNMNAGFLFVCYSDGEEYKEMKIQSSGPLVSSNVDRLIVFFCPSLFLRYNRVFDN
ncbi:hypothetical protein R6Q59_032382 [Mikania micrantha]